MYYSEFTIRLIAEVKKREILYNTKYEKRPRQEKEEAWREIGIVMNGLLFSIAFLNFLLNISDFRRQRKVQEALEKHSRPFRQNNAEPR